MIKTINKKVCENNIEYSLKLSTENLMNTNNSHEYQVNVRCLDSLEYILKRTYAYKEQAESYYNNLIIKVFK